MANSLFSRITRNSFDIARHCENGLVFGKEDCPSVLKRDQWGAKGPNTQSTPAVGLKPAPGRRPSTPLSGSPRPRRSQLQWLGDVPGNKEALTFFLSGNVAGYREPVLFFLPIPSSLAFVGRLARHAGRLMGLLDIPIGDRHAVVVR